MRKPMNLVAATLVLAGSAFAVPTPTAAPALLPSERGWLSPLEASAYDQKVKDDPAGAISGARLGVTEHLPADVRSKYKKLTTPPIDAVRVNTFLYNVVSLTPNEVAWFEAHDKAGFQKYQSKMAALQGPDHAIPLEKRDEAHAVVLHYRAITAAPRKGKTPPSATPAPAAGAAVPLTAREKGWLADAESKAYDAALAKKPLSKSDRLQVIKQYRDAVAKDLPDEDARKAYAAKVAAGPDPAQIDAYLLTLVELSGDELAALEKIVKGKEPAGVTLTNANARKDYEGEMAPLATEGGHPVPKETRRANAIVAKYRAMLKAAGVAPAAPGVPTDVTAGPAGAGGLTDREQKTLTDAEKAAYKKEIDDAKGDKDKIAAIAQKYRKIAAGRDIDVFHNLPDDQQKDLCAPYKNYVAGSGAPVSADQAAACSNPDLKPCLKKDGKGYDEKCVADLKAKCVATQGPAATTPSASLPPLSDDVKKACAALNQSLTPPAGPGPGPVTTTVPDPSTKKGTDKDPKKEEKKGFFDSMTKETASNIKAGAAGAVLGILVGSFFGPVGMLVGAAIGGGALFGANYALNKMP